MPCKHILCHNFEKCIWNTTLQQIIQKIQKELLQTEKIEHKQGEEGEEAITPIAKVK